MLPFEIPPGTTLDALVTTVIPEAHARLVPASAGKEPFACVVELEPDLSWLVTLDGQKMTARAGSEKNVDARIRSRRAWAEAFLADWTGEGKLVPKGPPPEGAILISDPRALKRLRMVTGVVELALRDFDADGEPPRRVSMTVAVGGPARKVEPDPDVVIETGSATYLRVLSGELAPEDALADGDVTVTGKRLVAMQFALALSALVPKKGG